MNMNNKKRVGVLSTLSDLNPAYSVAGVITNQLKALVKYGYTPVLFALTNFKGEVPEGVELRAIVPQLILEPYVQRNLDNLEEDVQKATKAFEQNMTDIDVMLTHDIIFI